MFSHDVNSKRRQQRDSVSKVEEFEELEHFSSDSDPEAYSVHGQNVTAYRCYCLIQPIVFLLYYMFCCCLCPAPQ